MSLGVCNLSSDGSKELRGSLGRVQTDKWVGGKGLGECWLWNSFGAQI